VTLFPKVHLAMSGDIFVYYNWREGAAAILWGQCYTSSTLQDPPFTPETYLDENVNSTQDEKSCPRCSSGSLPLGSHSYRLAWVWGLESPSLQLTIWMGLAAYCGLLQTVLFSRLLRTLNRNDHWGVLSKCLLNECLIAHFYLSGTCYLKIDMEFLKISLY
jgi:ribosomal protein S27AE